MKGSSARGRTGPDFREWKGCRVPDRIVGLLNWVPRVHRGWSPVKWSRKFGRSSGLKAVRCRWCGPPGCSRKRPCTFRCQLHRFSDANTKSRRWCSAVMRSGTKTHAAMSSRRDSKEEKDGEAGGKLARAACSLSDRSGRFVPADTHGAAPPAGMPGCRSGAVYARVPRRTCCVRGRFPAMELRASPGGAIENSVFQVNVWPVVLLSRPGASRRNHDLRRHRILYQVQVHRLR